MSVIDLGHEHGLTLRQVEILHGARRIRGPVSLGVPPGEVVTVMGPSGCGQSSLLAALRGPPAAALSSRRRVLLTGQDIAERPPGARPRGISLPADPAFPTLSLAANPPFVLRP